MSLKSTLEIINEIEKDFPVSSLEYKGLKIWPILRLTHTYFKTVARKQDKVPTPTLTPLFGKSHTKSNTLQNLVKNGIGSSILSNIFDKNSNNSLTQQVNTVILMNYAARRTTVEKRHFNEILNSLDYFINQSSVNLEYSIFHRAKIPRYGQSRIISHVLVKDFITAEIKTKLFLTKKEKKVLLEYTNFLKERNIIANTNPYFIFRYINRILAYKKSFFKILTKLAPKNVYLTSYYSPVLMGAILACNELNIRTIDVQHGIISDIHPMYGSWKNFPEGGYDLLPSHFWTWSNTFAETINSWVGKNQRHKVLVGGNPWFTFIKEKGISIEEEDKLVFEQVIKNKKNIVLISLQLVEDFKNSCLIKAMEKADDSFIWLIRLHPNFRKFTPEIKQFLEDRGCRNFEFEYANKLSIYYLFEKVTIQVSFWSTVILEALSYNLHTIVIHPNGLAAFEEYINRGILKYTQDAKKLITLIMEDEFTPEGKDKYIEADTQVIRKTLNELNK